ncbi:hypothetical protein FVEG_16905 [Fusarium verticillioides 7600]|uniref:Glucose-methanol-choline oxidoreductase C-terminal domain-containing protein n=1 Tax=Gibberella moniliformis (strain M3125 / FGSC 7600) TaxID=334819 RepID=W7MWK4_GIBM7|nr:hypothetical protein FVEG_16905 [Fusarium verticillioides 7600]EWG52045.1 hypothetical protein FVEG_16905 [Fusarium verticillioides 7600]
MGSHWTCCTPRQHKGIERSDLFSDSEWDSLYSRAEKLFKKNDDAFDDSVRQRLVRRVLTEAYPDREMKSMPLACKRKEGNKEYVEWSCTATILGELSTPEYFYKGGERLFDIRPNTQCDKLEVDAQGKIHWAVINDLENNKEYYIEAKKYVVCAGAVLTPGILYKSGLEGKLPKLGHYLTEQPMARSRQTLTNALLSIFADQFGMPQPIFNFILDEEAEERCKRMITDMIDVARKLGGFLPGAEPKYLAPGSALHICGTYRAGSTSADSVVNKNGKAWGVNDLVLGGCDVIPTQNACNPTLTAACFALAAADKIIEELHVDQ